MLCGFLYVQFEAVGLRNTSKSFIITGRPMYGKRPHYANVSQRFHEEHPGLTLLNRNERKECSEPAKLS